MKEERELTASVLESDIAHFINRKSCFLKGLVRGELGPDSLHEAWHIRIRSYARTGADLQRVGKRELHF
jgi:hypothetical protein